MSIGRENKNKGNEAEKHYEDFFKSLGYLNCVSSKGTAYDGAGIDLLNLPFYIQVKSGIQKNLNPSHVLHDIKARISSMLPFAEDKPLLLLHKKNVRGERERNEFDEIISMSIVDFVKLINLNKNGESNTRI